MMSEERKVTMGGDLVSLRGEEMKVGAVAPSFTVLTNALKEQSLEDLGEGVKLISVVPSIDTGVCSLQTRRFDEAAGELSDATFITLSVDLPFAQKRFVDEHQLQNITLYSDHRNLDFGTKYGFVIDELRLLSRGIVVLNGANEVTYIEYVSEVTDHPDYDAALAAVKALLEA